MKTDKGKPREMNQLAQAILDYDKSYPGEPDASVEIPADQWRKFVALAKIKACDFNCIWCKSAREKA